MEQRRSIGWVKWFCPTKGYGFLQDMKGGSDAFVHFSNLCRRSDGWKGLYKGEYVSYIPQESGDRICALDVTGVAGGVLMCEASALTET